MNFDTFNINLTVISAFNCRDSSVRQVIVYPTPKANFTINDSSQCFSGNSFNFTNKSTIPSGQLNYAWYFGDGTSVSITDPSHHYLLPGIYQVKLRVASDLSCSDSMTHQLNVYPMPVASFAISDSIQCFKANKFLFTNASTISAGTMSYKWDFGDNSTSLLTNPVHGYLNDGTFNIRLIANSGFKCTDSMIKKVTVYPSPIVDFTVNDSTQCLKKNLVLFRNNSNIHQGTIKFDWDFGDGFKSKLIDSFTHQYTTYGTFKNKLVATSNLGCKDSATRVMSIFPMPKADFIIDDSSQCLDGNLFRFTNISGIPYGNLSFYWYLDDGYTSTLKDVSHSYNNCGNYNVSLVVNSQWNCYDTMTEKLAVHHMPDARFVFTKPCLDDTLSFTDMTVINIPDKIISWQWDFGDGNSSLLQNPLNTFTSPGLYSVKLVVTSDNQCIDNVTQQVRINPHVTANVITRATVENDTNILVEWEAISTGIPEKYVIERSLDNICFFNIKALYPGYLSYTDEIVDVNRFSYIYRMKVIDSCGYSSPYSNIAKTILLVIEKNTLHPVMHWTTYKEWTGGVKEYDIYLKDDHTNSFNMIGSIIDDTTFIDNVTYINQAEYCYRIVAISQNGVESTSNDVCVPTPFNLWIPNAFSPNNDEYNNRFKVSGTYIMEFHVTIFDRWGEKVYESSDIDEGWDGTYLGHDSSPGYYYYRIIANGTKGQKKNVDGMLLLLR